MIYGQRAGPRREWSVLSVYIYVENQQIEHTQRCV